MPMNHRLHSRPTFLLPRWRSRRKIKRKRKSPEIQSWYLNTKNFNSTFEFFSQHMIIPYYDIIRLPSKIRLVGIKNLNAINLFIELRVVPPWCRGIRRQDLFLRWEDSMWWFFGLQGEIHHGFGPGSDNKTSFLLQYNARHTMWVISLHGLYHCTCDYHEFKYVLTIISVQL